MGQFSSEYLRYSGKGRVEVRKLVWELDESWGLGGELVELLSCPRQIGSSCTSSLLDEVSLDLFRVFHRH